MKLTGWDIDIISETEYNKIRKGEIESQLEELQEENTRDEEDAEADEDQTETGSQEELASEDEEQDK
jgi:hypothetical protein